MKRLPTLLAVLVLAGCSLLNSPPSEAATVTVTWTNPTANTDESPIPTTGEGSLASWRIEYGTCSAPGVFGTFVGQVVRPRTGPELTSAVLNLNPGTTCVRVFTSNTYAVESDASNVATRVVDPPRPRAPTNVTTS